MIENTLERIAVALEKIAAQLTKAPAEVTNPEAPKLVRTEKKVGSQTVVTITPEPAPAPEPTPAPEPPPAPAPEPAKPSAPAVDLKLLQKHGMLLVEAGKQADLKRIVSESGAGRLAELAPEKYAEVLAKLEALTKALSK